MAGEMHPQDAASGLVERSWVRTSRRRGKLTERTLEGETVSARFLGGSGQLQQAEGTVSRDASGRLVVESWADGVRTETPIGREAIMERRGR